MTGAGKTEMIYQVVAKVIDDGGSVCLASPRIDDMFELYKRLQNDFACEIAHMGISTLFFELSSDCNDSSAIKILSCF